MMSRTVLAASRLLYQGHELRLLCPLNFVSAGKFSAFSSSAQRQQLDISGILPPIPTPFNADESIAYDKLELNMQKWNKIPFKGYVVQGSNGECCFLSFEERIKMVKEVKRLAGPNKLIVAGSGCESTWETISLSQKLADAGAQAVLVVNPFYFKASMNHEALTNHFTKVADQLSVPVILYNVPSNTGMDIPPEVVIKLAKHPNIIGMKDSSGDIIRIASLVYSTASENFQILSGSAGFLLPSYSVGCVGGICGLANVLGEEVCRLSDLSNSKDVKAAKELQLRIVGPNACVTRRFGVPGLKATMEWFGYYGGPTRSPLVALTPSEAAVVKQFFQKSNFL
jgi:4-hydroxy-2-oxoglutarate aldolase